MTARGPRYTLLALRAEGERDRPAGDLQSLCDRLNDVFNTDETPDALSQESVAAIEALWRERDAARAELAAVRETLGAAHHALRNVDECWSFGGRQEPTHTWHTREDWRERHRETLEKAHDPQ